MIKKLLPILTRIGLGIVDAVPVLGTVKENLSSKAGGEGKPDYVRLIANVTTAVVAIAALYLFAQGKLSFEQLEELVK